MFSVKVKQPNSIAGYAWNFVMDMSATAQIAFIVLKLTGVITWSWWWVLSPLCFGGIQFVLVVLALFLAISRWGR